MIVVQECQGGEEGLKMEQSEAGIRMHGVKRLERNGGISWRKNTTKRLYISSMSQASYSVTTSLFYLSFLFFTLCPLTSPLLSLLYLCSKYPGAVNSNRSLNDTSLHWQVLSSCATIGKKDLRKDKIGPTNSDNSKHIMARNSFPMVLHCHLVVDAATGYRISSAGYWSLVTVSYITAMWSKNSEKMLCTCNQHKSCEL